MQWIASTALTVASLIVAVVALRFSYRSNHGWPPIIFITSQGLSHTDDGGDKITIGFEVWNRRKYPIVIRGCGVSFANIAVAAMDDWITFEGEALWHGASITVEPSKHHQIQAHVRLVGAKLSELRRAPMTVEAHFFDPLANRVIGMKQRTIFMTWRPYRWWTALYAKFRKRKSVSAK
jgi:hypothetical protein